jgi:RNA recognition motif-containing protein
VNIYVGNLSPETSEWQLRKAFEMYGKVGKTSIEDKPRDDSGSGFCYVAMPFDNQASRAIKEMSGKSLGGSVLTVKESGVSL